MLMKHFGIVALIVSVIPLQSSSAEGQLLPHSMTPEHANVWEAARKLDNINAIENSLAEGEWLSTHDTAKLRNVLEGERWPIQVRGAALSLLSRYVDMRDGDSVVDSLVVLHEQTPSREEATAGKKWFTVASLFSGFFRTEARQLQTRLEHPELLLDLYVMLADISSINRGIFIQSGAFELISKSPASLKHRQACLVHIAARLGELHAPQTLYSLVDESVAQKLREFAFGDNGSRADWNVFALDLLADFGDLETAKMVREAKIAYGEDPALLERPGGLIWIIRARNNPKILLEFLRTHEFGINIKASRQHILGAAIRWGIDRDSIAEAVLEHANAMGKPGCNAWHEYARLRHLCIKVGILNDSELPQIPVKHRPNFQHLIMTGD